MYPNSGHHIKRPGRTQPLPRMQSHLMQKQKLDTYVPETYKYYMVKYMLKKSAWQNITSQKTNGHYSSFINNLADVCKLSCLSNLARSNPIRATKTDRFILHIGSTNLGPNNSKRRFCESRYCSISPPLFPGPFKLVKIRQERKKNASSFQKILFSFEIDYTKLFSTIHSFYFQVVLKGIMYKRFSMIHHLKKIIAMQFVNWHDLREEYSATPPGHFF